MPLLAGLAALAAVVPPLYRAIVAVIVRGYFGELNKGNWQAVNDGLAAEFTYHFHGDHALGGTRRRRATMDAWWQRLFRILPDARWEVQDVLVAGPPWATRVSTHATIRGHLPEGTPYENAFKQRIVLRFGKVVSVETLEDSQRLERAMNALAAKGFEEAVAAPLVD